MSKPSDSPWEELLEEIDDMLNDDMYEWAEETLEGIREWVARSAHCTEKQETAVANIRASAE